MLRVPTPPEPTPGRRSYSWGNHDESRHDPQILQIVGVAPSLADQEAS
jgi:hypothetical protein